MKKRRHLVFYHRPNSGKTGSVFKITTIFWTNC